MAESLTVTHMHSYRHRLLTTGFFTVVVLAGGCQPHQPASESPSSGSSPAQAVPSPAEGTTSPSFMSVPGPAVSLRCTTVALDIAHGEWSSETRQHVRTFEHVLGTAEAQRWKAEQNHEPATIWDVQADGTRIEWLPEAAIVWPVGPNATCTERTPTYPLQPVVCATLYEAGTPWDVELTMDSSTSVELATALSSFHNAPEEAEAAPAICQHLAAVWQSTGPVPAQNEIRMRWCDESGPVYVQRRRVAHGVSRLQLERCQPEAGAGPRQP